MGIQKINSGYNVRLNRETAVKIVSTGKVGTISDVWCDTQKGGIYYYQVDGKWYDLSNMIVSVEL